MVFPQPQTTIQFCNPRQPLTEAGDCGASGRSAVSRAEPVAPHPDRDCATSPNRSLEARTAEEMTSRPNTATLSHVVSSRTDWEVVWSQSCGV